MKKLTQQEFVEQAQKVNPELDFSESIYINKRSNLTAKCAKHGYFTMQASSFFRHVSCPQCDLEARKNLFIKQAQEIHQYKYI